MKNTISVIAAVIFLFEIALGQNDISKAPRITSNEFGRILDSLSIKGSILVYDSENNKCYSNDFEWANTGYLPASTFKIPNTVIGIETGAVENDSTVFIWDGNARAFKSWEKHLTLREAFKVSCVPCYQEIARRIGLQKMKEYLRKFNYGKMVFEGGNLDMFWLEGDSKISQFGQIEFLQKLYFSELPVSENTIKLVKSIMVAEKNPDYTLSAKTGWSGRAGKDNGWYVGFLETRGNVFFFAVNVFPDKGIETDKFLPARINAARAGLKALGAIK